MTALASVVQVLLTLVSGLLPSLGVSSTNVIAQIIAGLENIVPVLASEGAALLTEVQSIIASLRNGSTPLTADQLTALDTLDAQIDAAFEADATAAGFPAPPASGA
ncbi:MAG: hypothetical protein KGL39_54120 [Patescibacteria group bacterium]|nr:hypothetical protein [Patescibacteria group bacterium]